MGRCRYGNLRLAVEMKLLHQQASCSRRDVLGRAGGSDQAELHMERRSHSLFFSGFGEDADGVEAERGVEGGGGDVDSADAGDHAVALKGLAGGDEFGQQGAADQGAADTIADAVRADADGVFDGAAVAFAVGMTAVRGDKQGNGRHEAGLCAALRFGRDDRLDRTRRGLVGISSESPGVHRVLTGAMTTVVQSLSNIGTRAHAQSSMLEGWLPLRMS